MSSLRERDPFDVRLARTAPAPLGAFNDAGVLSSADVQVARRLATLGGVEAPSLLLALALAVRAPRLGHVLVDLADIRTTVAVDTEEPVDLGALPWPEPAAWAAEVAACGLVAVSDDDGDDAGDARPLRLVGSRLYLDRYWREERQVAADLRERAVGEAAGVARDVLAEGMARLYPDRDDERARMAAATAVLRRIAVIAGGPGTGKTATVARIVALLADQADAPPLVALAAPTGKAAARLTEEVHGWAGRLAIDDGARERLRALTATTLHRLLGTRPGSRSRFRHDRNARLPHDVVIVDETSMVSLTLMARLLDAIRPDARLILLGDPDQLTSIEAGAVLGDIVGPAAARPLLSADARARLAEVGAAAPPSGAAPPSTVVGGAPSGGDAETAAAALPDAPLADGVVVLDRLYRYRGGIAVVADAVRRGVADDVVAALADARDDVTWIDGDVAELRGDARLAPVRDAATEAGRAVIAAARAGDADAALDALRRFGLLCAHRRGPYGVSAWMPVVESWLATEIEAAGGRAQNYPGRPLLVTAKHDDLHLYNGDTGVIVRASEKRLVAAFERTTVRPNQLGAVETVYAMTVHKSQGSQFDTAAVLLPPPTSRILTRELLYTGVTRARDRLLVVGTEASIRAAIDRPAARASGLRARLWDAG
ncbi:RecBCD enzyme subunit RecD [Baekduia alba]|uniref:exodeoxyribonuclease V subunit alpha n=1 Tax=Baekduia alba TaxID=2997333 RepID=UPI00233FB5B0|nr:exodeoxyribonuclease V subunit alpha [Baekduia alba]WCB92984.1 RecBCD enzyme subunit RecD [Baekduia alba]